MVKNKNKTKESVAGSSEVSLNMDLEKLVRRRSRAKSDITRLENFFIDAENDNSVDINEFSIRETRLVKAFETYLDIQNLIEDEDESQEQDRIETEQKFCHLQAKYKTKIQKHFLQSNQNSVNSQQQIQSQSGSDNGGVNLPKLNIPTFTGKYEEWQAYFDLFSAL